VQYTLCSCGRPIGATDLGFVPISRRWRFGWFHPNSLGQELIPLIAPPDPEMPAHLQRSALEEHESALAHSDVIRAACFQALGEFFARVQALDLTLHLDDGTLVQTVHIGIQDTDLLLAMADSPLTGEDDWMFEDEESWDVEDDEPWDVDEVKAWSPDQDLEAEWPDLDEIIERFSDEWRPCLSEEEPSTFPRYQIYVEFVDDLPE
jgi:hypothetical protein